MEFDGIDPKVALKRMKKKISVFEAALVKMQRVDNFDDRMPSGLSKFSHFFYAHHTEIYADSRTDSNYRLFLDWMERNDQESSG